MASRDSTLREIGLALLSCAEGAVLDAPLDRLSSRVTDDLAREVLEAIHEAGEAHTLRDLLAGETLDRWVAAQCTAREEEALSAELGRWLGVGHVGDDDPARLARVAPLPDELEGILAWARPHGLLGELSRPAAEVLVGAALSGLDADASLVECCLGGASEAVRGASLLSGERARGEARRHLMREAAAHASLSAREALWRRVPEEGPMRALAERLRAIVADAAMASLHSVRFVPARRVTIDGETGVARAELHGGDGEVNVAVRLLLSGYEQRGPTGECARCARPGCLHVRALAARLLDACCDEGDRLHGPLAEFSSVPSWKRFVRALAPEERGAPRGNERLGFRLRIDGARASVGVVARKTGADGRLTTGKLVAPQKAARSASRTDVDRAVLDAMTKVNRPLSSLFVPADLALLRSLVEHPFVSIEAGADSVRVVEESLHVALVEAPGGLSVEVSLGGAKLAPREPSRVGYVLHLDGPGGTLSFAALTPSLRRLLSALADFRGVLPPESHPDIARWAASIEKVARVSAPKALRGMERPASERLLLRIAPTLDEGVDVALVSRALPMSPLWPPGKGPELAHGLDSGAQIFARRDLAKERALGERAIAALGLADHMLLEPFVYRVPTTEAALELLSRAARHADLLEIEWAERARRFAITSVVRASDLAIRLFKKGEWCKLEGGARSAGADVAVGRLLDAARRGERFVRVEGDDYVELERDLFDRLRLAQLTVTESLREPALAASAAPFFLSQLAGIGEGGDPETRAWLARATERPSAPIPEASRPHLREYQKEGAAFLIERSRWAPGACLADEMGLGKTAQTIALLEARAALGPALVVAPTSVVDNWVHELARFAPSLDARTHRGAARQDCLVGLGPGAVVVTSYELLLRDVERFRGVRFATEVVDEAQMVKNARTERAKAVRSVDAAFRVALSGTPVENRLGDLWSLFQLIAPGLLGSWARFRARFAVPIERYEDDDRARALRALVSPFILRRTKDEVAIELPSRTEVVHMVELSPAEQELYDAALKDARRAFGKRRKTDAARSVQILAELTRLRQLACHPRLVIDDTRLESSKLHALLALLEDILPRGHRALLFSQFTSHLALVREALDAAAIPYLSLDGSTPAARRASLVARFQAGEGAVFLISLKAGGTGLNLTAADYVVHLDPWWNPAAEDQASDRAHRLGQERPLTIVKLVSQGTIEESVLALHGHKRRLAEAVLAGSATPAELDREALESLLALR